MGTLYTKRYRHYIDTHICQRASYAGMIPIRSKGQVLHSPFSAYYIGSLAIKIILRYNLKVLVKSCARKLM